MSATVLYIFSGLPGSGKTTLAKGLSSAFGCVYLRIDTLEHAMRKLGGVVKADEGYQMGYSLAADNLYLGQSVVADSCNPVNATRKAWMDVALQTSSSYINIEVVCSDAGIHRKRVERREADIPGLELPTWQQVQAREYHRWDVQPIVVDTCGVDAKKSLEGLLEALLEHGIRVGALPVSGRGHR